MAQEAITQAFRRLLQRRHNLIGHPKSDLLWNMAWEYGHSGGYCDILYYYDELVELVKE